MPSSNKKKEKKNTYSKVMIDPVPENERRSEKRTSLMREDGEDEGEERALEDILEDIPIGRFHYRLLVICGMAFMADAMEVSLLSFVSTCAGADWDLSDSEIALIASIVFIGVLIGALFWGPFSDKYGRRKGFIFGCGIIIFFGFMSGLSPNYGSLLFFRGMLGFGVGGSTVPFDLLAEFLPNSHRGRFLIYIEYFWTLGSIFVAGIAWILLSDSGWRVLVYVTALPVTISLAWAIFVLPESPRWLLEKGRTAEAEEVMRQSILANGTELGYPIRLKPSVEREDEVKGVSMTDFVKPGQRGLSIPLWTVWFAFGFAYYGIILYVTRVFDHTNEDDGDDDSNDSCDFEYSEIFLSAFAELIGVLVAAYIIDRWGRIRTQTSMYFFAGVGALLMGVMNATGTSDEVIAAFGILARCSIMGASCATWVCTPELFPTHLRVTGHSIASSVARIGAFAAPFVVDDHAISLFAVGLILAIVNFVGTGSAAVLPETLGKDLDSVAKEKDIVRQVGDDVKNVINISPHESVDDNDNIATTVLRNGDC